MFRNIVQTLRQPVNVLFLFRAEEPKPRIVIVQTTAPTVVREEPAPCRVKLNIEVPHADVAQTLQELEREFRKVAKIPGFRPGKAPRQLLWRRHGDDIRGEAKDRLLQSGLRAALEQEDLQPETPPHIDNRDNLVVNPDDSFVFAAEFDVRPEFELPEYKGLGVSCDPVDVSDDRVEEAINQMLSSRTSYEKVERPAASDDLLKVSYKGTLAEPVEDLSESARYLLEADDTWLPLCEPELLPGAAAQLTGANPGDARDIDVAFPEGFHESALAGKSASYTVHVHEVHAASTPELDDDVARELGADDAEDARNRIRQNMEQRAKGEQDQAVRARLLNTILAKVDFPLPPQRLTGEIYGVLQALFQERARQGVSEDTLKEQGEELRQEAERIARIQLKRHYVLDRIAQQEGIEVPTEDVQQAIQYLAATHRTDAKDMLKRLQDSGRIYDLVEQVRQNKVMDYLIEHADIQDSVSAAPEDGGGSSSDTD